MALIVGEDEENIGGQGLVSVQPRRLVRSFRDVTPDLVADGNGKEAFNEL